MVTGHLVFTLIVVVVVHIVMWMVAIRPAMLRMVVLPWVTTVPVAAGLVVELVCKQVLVKRGQLRVANCQCCCLLSCRLSTCLHGVWCPGNHLLTKQPLTRGAINSTVSLLMSCGSEGIYCCCDEHCSRQTLQQTYLQQKHMRRAEKIVCTFNGKCYHPVL